MTQSKIFAKALIGALFVTASYTPAMLSTSSIPSAMAQAKETKGSRRQNSRFEALLADHWDFTLAQSPTFATSLGVRDYDDRLGSNSLANYDAVIAKTRDFQERLSAISIDKLSTTNQFNYKLFARGIENQLRDADFGGKYLIMTNRNGPHTQISRLPDSLPFFTLADYESYIARLHDTPRFFDESIETLDAGAKAGWTQACVSMAGVGQSIHYHVVENAEDSVFMKPFASRPDAIDAARWDDLSARARTAILEKTVPAYKKYADFYDETYAPACRENIGASSLPDGADYYQYRANNFTTTTRTPDQIHETGLSEVTRIRAEMQKIIEEVEFEGSFKEFQTFLRTDPQFYAKTEAELVGVTSTIAKRIDGELPKLFTVLPRMPYTVKPVPADIAEGTTTAYYERPAGDGSRAGVYRINTSLLDQRPLFELEALTLHEGVPGHHFQIALSQELDLPPFRAFGGFTAFVEGWGLYAESLGLDVGFYQDPYANFGRLSYEMWRACRLVVDTGMHAKGWSRDQAIAFMTENTALSEHNIKAEIDRYITWPGQALAYKTGQLKIKELREHAASSLGDKFDLRLFHDAVLKNGAIPLSILEEQINQFIQTEQNK